MSNHPTIKVIDISNGELIFDLSGKKIRGNQGTYIIDKHLARGTRSNLYKAIWEDRQEYVCAKILTFQMTDEDIRQMHREETALSKLNHPNIVRIHDAISFGGFHCTIMEYFPDGSLADKLRGGSISLFETGSIIEQIAGAIDFAHSKGVVHQDIKPANILIDQGRAVISDFGIARVVGEQIGTKAPTGVYGTPAYMSPEQITGELVGNASDQYSLAVVAFEMLGGRVPHKGSSAMATLYSKINDPVPSLSALNPDVTSDVEEVILRGLEKVPSKRFRSATEFAHALNEAIRSPKKKYAKPVIGRQKFTDLLPNLSAKRGLFLVFLVAFLGSFIGTTVAALLLLR